VIEFKMLIGGEMCGAARGATNKVTDPSTEEAFATVPRANAEDVKRACEAARAAFDEGDWPRMAQKERMRLLLELADRLDARSPVCRFARPR